MNLVVQRYKLNVGNNKIDLPYGAKLLGVIGDNGEAFLLALQKPGERKISEVEIYGVRNTQKFAGELYDEYLGSVVQMETLNRGDNRFIFHEGTNVYSFFQKRPNVKVEDDEL